MAVLSYFAASFMGLPLLVILLLNLFPKKIARKCSLVFSAAVAVVQMVTSLLCISVLWKNGADSIKFSMLWEMNIAGAEYFTVDFLSLVLLLCVGIVCFASVLVATHTITEKRVSYSSLLMILVLGLNGVAVVNDLFSLYVFMEITGIASFVLISIHKQPTGLEGAFKYLVMSAIAGVFVLAGLALLFMNTGSLLFADLTMETIQGLKGTHLVLVSLAFALLIAGFCIKSGIAPFHSWLPDAHQSADTAVSVLLSGIVIEIVGIYPIMRIVGELFTDVPALNTTLAALGLFTILYGALAALRQNNFKRVIAYSSVSQVGYILLGIASGTQLGLLGALCHIVSHAAFKSTLFVNAAAIHSETDTLDMDKMGGLQEKMPVTGTTSVIAFLSTAGIPPFAGFWSKLVIIIAVWQAISPVFAGIALVSGIFTAAYLLRMQKKVFFGKLAEGLEKVREIKGCIKFAEIFLTVLTVGIGLLFPALLLILQAQGLL
jgi:multicomponent Na+:H+ antiporter subunit D